MEENKHKITILFNDKEYIGVTEKKETDWFVIVKSRFKIKTIPNRLKWQFYSLIYFF